ncbi:MAG: cell division protein SepF [Selenomonadaceae bacterium]|nr:cell division protein SepF [Selenomonadaceae bacterium]
MVVMDWIKKVTDLIMPLESAEEEDYVEEKKSDAKATENKSAQVHEVKETRKVAAAGGGVARAALSTSESGAMSVDGKRYVAYETSTPDTEDKPALKVVKSPEFSVKIYHSVNGSQVCAVADDILSRKAAVVNYEALDEAEQRRICDFINGVCYASDGSVRMISDRIFLYVPAGINSEDIAMAAASVYSHR